MSEKRYTNQRFGNFFQKLKQKNVKFVQIIFNMKSNQVFFTRKYMRNRNVLDSGIFHSVVTTFSS